MIESKTPIETLYAFVGIEDDGSEGIIAVTMEEVGNIPFVFSDKKLIEMCKPLAIDAAKAAGKRIKLIQMTSRKVLYDFDPRH